MLFRLLKEAQLTSKFSPAEMVHLENARVALGEQSILDLLESFAPTQDDYDTWLSVIVDEATERNISIGKKGAFLDLAGMVLDNDPTPPPADMQPIILSKLWNEYNAAKNGVRVEKAFREKEEEEALQAGEELMNSPATGDFDDESVFGGSDDALDGCDGAGCDAPGNGDQSMDDLGAIDLDKDLGDSSEERSLSDADIDAIVGKIMSHYSTDGSMSSDVDSEDDTDEQAFPKFAERQQFNTEEEERSVMTAKAGEQVTPKTNKTFLQQMMSGPRTNITQAQKEIEAEGEAAWKAHNVPRNPHPKKSIAHGAWERGMKRAAKAHFGFDDKPVQSTSKPRKK